MIKIDRRSCGQFNYQSRFQRPSSITMTSLIGCGCVCVMKRSVTTAFNCSQRSYMVIFAKVAPDGLHKCCQDYRAQLIRLSIRFLQMINQNHSVFALILEGSQCDIWIAFSWKPLYGRLSQRERKMLVVVKIVIESIKEWFLSCAVHLQKGSSFRNQFDGNAIESYEICRRLC